jgi:hypothetical protein
MRRLDAIILLASASTAATVAEQKISVVSQVGAPIASLSVRPAGGTEWTSVAPGLSPGARIGVSLPGEGCAYELRAKLASGGEATWSINACETRSVILNRRTDGTAWVDYD